MNLQISKNIKSKKRSFIICFLLVFINSSFAQITFQKTYGGAQDGYFNSVEQTTDEGYIMVGATMSFGAGGYDVYLVKTDLNGDTLWTKTYGGINNDFGNYAQQTTDSGYIIIGITRSFVSSIDRIYLIKTDANGDTLWTKTYNPASYGAVGLDVRQTFDGGYILVGGYNLDNVGFLIKTDAVGDTLWIKSYGISSSGTNEISQTADGGYIIIGTGYDGTTATYMYLVKTDINGIADWKKAYRGSSFYAQPTGWSVRQTPDGGYIAAGYIDTMPAEVYLVKTNSLGDTLWTKSFGGDSIIGVGLSVFLTSDSGYIIAGYTGQLGSGTSDVYLIKTDSVGNILFSKSFGGSNSELINSVRQTSDGGFILAGKTNSFGSGSYDAYLIKTDASGSSGCFENSVATALRATPTIVTLPADTFLLDPFFVNSYSALEGNGGNTNTLCTTVEINELIELNPICIYPNPARYNFTISINGLVLNANVEIYNIHGEKIYSSKLVSKQNIITCEAFSSGIYFISVRTDNNIITRKLIFNK